MIKRFLAFAFFVGFILAPVSDAYADEKYWRASVQSASGWGKTAPEACTSAGVNATTPTITYRFHSYQVQTATTGRCAFWNSTNTGGLYNGGATEYTCSGATPFFSYKLFKCVATPDIEPKPCDDKNPFIRRFNYGKSSGPFPSPDHYNECNVEPVEMMVCRKDVLTAETYCIWTVKRTGTKYEGTPNPITGGEDKVEKTTDAPVTSPPLKPSASDPSKCPAGTVQAGSSADGVPICMGTGTKPKPVSKPPAPKAETSTSETLPDGSVKKTDVVTTTNSDGSKTTNTTVTIIKPDGAKETTGDTSTSPTPTGSPGQEDRPQDEDKFDLCKQNPNLSICRESSVNGTCGEIACVGDAIQCATLRAAAAMQCQQEKDLDDLAARPEVAAGNAILSGADPMKGAIDDALNGTEVDMSQPNLDASGFVSNKSCLAPRSFTAGGHTIQVEFAILCDNIEPLRYLVLACAWIVAYLIVSRSVLGT